MFLTIEAPLNAADLGYLLLKNPSRLHSFNLSFGKAHVFYPERGATRSSAALYLDIDPIGLVRRRHKSGEPSLRQYVNDRPYVASSFLSVAISQVFGTAMAGRSKERQHLAEEALSLEASIAALPSRGGPGLLEKIFEPLGYQIEAKQYFLDDRFPDWGLAPYQTVHLRNRVRLRDLLTHLYVLIPALDAEKHYWVGDDEVEKLLRKGEGWLAGHPACELIVNRYLRFDRKLTQSALSRLTDEDDGLSSNDDLTRAAEEESLEAPTRLWEQRLGAILSVLRARSAENVVDLGCGEGKLLAALLNDQSFTRIVGLDVSWRSLEIASQKLKLDRLPTSQQQRISLLHGSLMYRDTRLSGFQAAVASEVIEHLDPPRLTAFEQVVFAHARPQAVVVTTPNSEFNALFPTLPPGTFRHRDHRFEWTRAEFRRWSESLAARFGYTVEFLPVGPVDPLAGSPTQMAVFAL